MDSTHDPWTMSWPIHHGFGNRGGSWGSLASGALGLQPLGACCEVGEKKEGVTGVPLRPLTEMGR
jgi:hypothetical protein